MKNKHCNDCGELVQYDGHDCEDYNTDRNGEKMKEYMCANCGGGFSSKEMYFDTEYDCDLCSDCYCRAEKKNKR